MYFQAIIALALTCAAPTTPQDLRPAYCEAVWSWFPYVPTVRLVQWCESDYECDTAQVGQGGGYETSSQTITIDKRWPFVGTDLVLTLKHEVGHALGLEHSAAGIMRQGWEPPLADGPGPEDFAALATLH